MDFTESFINYKKRILPLSNQRMPGIYGRLELVIEGSHDGIDWKEYEFYYKPIKINERPKFSFTHQPRIDWQVFFSFFKKILKFSFF